MKKSTVKDGEVDAVGEERSEGETHFSHDGDQDHPTEEGDQHGGKPLEARDRQDRYLIFPF